MAAVASIDTLSRVSSGRTSRARLEPDGSRDREGAVRCPHERLRDQRSPRSMALWHRRRLPDRRAPYEAGRDQKRTSPSFREKPKTLVLPRRQPLVPARQGRGWESRSLSPNDGAEIGLARHASGGGAPAAVGSSRPLGSVRSAGSSISMLPPHPKSCTGEAPTDRCVYRNWLVAWCKVAEDSSCCGRGRSSNSFFGGSHPRTVRLTVRSKERGRWRCS
jgi:hypothetical protein